MQALETVIVKPTHNAAPRKTRISAKVRVAVDAMIEDGLKRNKAAETAGLTDNALYAALRKPDVLAYRNERLRVLRESEASRSIARVATLADTAASEHVKLGANELLMGIEGISKVTKTENMHVHQHVIPGLTVLRESWQPHEIGGQIIDQPKHAQQVRRIGAAVPHPEAKRDQPIEIIEP